MVKRALTLQKMRDCKRPLQIALCAPFNAEYAEGAETNVGYKKPASAVVSLGEQMQSVCRLGCGLGRAGYNDRAPRYAVRTRNRRLLYPSARH